MSIPNTILERYRANHPINQSHLILLNVDELLLLKEVVDTDLAQINSHLDAAKGRAAAGGQYADPAWFAKATHARRMKGRLSQSIQSQLGKKRRERQQAADREQEEERPSFHKRLIQAMKLVLTPEQREAVFEKARSLEKA